MSRAEPFVIRKLTNNNLNIINYKQIGLYFLHIHVAIVTCGIPVHLYLPETFLRVANNLILVWQ